MGVNQMTGTPWHLETLKMDENDDRRHKSRCIYYYKANKNCKRLNVKCPGSAHCDHYKEDPTRIRAIPNPQSSSSVYKPRTTAVVSNHTDAQRAVVSEIEYDGTMLYPIGCHVRHKTHGLGVVSKVEKDYVTVDFDEGFSKELGVEYCAKNALLIREITEEERRIAQEKEDAERKARETLRLQELELKEKSIPTTNPTISETIVSEGEIPTSKVAACSTTINSISTKANDSPSESKGYNAICWIVSIIIAYLILVTSLLYFFDSPDTLTIIGTAIAHVFLVIQFIIINPLILKKSSLGIIVWAKKHKIQIAISLFIIWFIIATIIYMIYTALLDN